MDDRRRRQILSDIADLKSTISRNREEIRRRQSMIPGARAKDVDEHQTVIRNLENTIKANERRVSELNRELR